MAHQMTHLKAYFISQTAAGNKITSHRLEKKQPDPDPKTPTKATLDNWQKNHPKTHWDEWRKEYLKQLCSVVLCSKQKEIYGQAREFVIRLYIAAVDGHVTKDEFKDCAKNMVPAAKEKINH